MAAIATGTGGSTRDRWELPRLVAAFYVVRKEYPQPGANPSSVATHGPIKVWTVA